MCSRRKMSGIPLIGTVTGWSECFRPCELLSEDHISRDKVGGVELATIAILIEDYWGVLKHVFKLKLTRVL
jgi:hypothetical protein